MKLRHLKPINQKKKKPQAKKPRNQETKNQEPRNQEPFFIFKWRESPAPVNLPTPTPAPDRGGPVACRGGPVACRDVHAQLRCCDSLQVQQERSRTSAT